MHEHNAEDARRQREDDRDKPFGRAVPVSLIREMEFFDALTVLNFFFVVLQKEKFLSEKLLIRKERDKNFTLPGKNSARRPTLMQEFDRRSQVCGGDSFLARGQFFYVRHAD